MNNFSKPLLTFQEVLQLLPINKSTLYSHMKTRKYPEPIKIGMRRIAWRTSDIKKLLNDFTTNKG